MKLVGRTCYKYTHFLSLAYQIIKMLDLIIGILEYNFLIYSVEHDDLKILLRQNKVKVMSIFIRILKIYYDLTRLTKSFIFENFRTDLL